MDGVTKKINKKLLLQNTSLLSKRLCSNPYEVLKILKVSLKISRGFLNLAISLPSGGIFYNFD